MRFQTSTPSSKYLSLRHRMSLNSERGGGLEAAHHCEADLVRYSKIAEG